MRYIKYSIVCILLLASILLYIPCTAAQTFRNDQIIRVGLLFGSSAVESYATRAANGFDLGYVMHNNNTVFVPVTSVSNTAVTVRRGASAHALTLVDTNTGAVIHEFNHSDRNFAKRARGSNALITTPANNQYHGVFEYRRGTSGIEVITLIDLDTYIKGVTSVEVFSSWPHEALKAFGLAARTYTLHSLNRHRAQGFMLCASGHCQAYRGSRLVNAAITEAVNSTRGYVITYNNRVILATYFSSAGGVTETHNLAWGFDLRHPYLVSVELPFENYTAPGRTNGTWTRTATPAELTEFIRGGSAFRGITGTVERLFVSERSEPSGYAREVTAVDNRGNRASVRNSDAVRIALSRFLPSANVDIFNRFNWAVNDEREAVFETRGLHIMTADGITEYAYDAAELVILTANGWSRLTTNDYIFVFDGRGWGHGVGMSQWAMFDKAMLGYNYRDIIKAFYTGVEITPLAWADP